jgi:hypothetical protein
MFVLKVIDDEANGVYRADTEHINGGEDMVQMCAFQHLFATGYCLWVYRSLVFEMAHLHGWDVEVRVLNKTT